MDDKMKDKYSSNFLDLVNYKPLMAVIKYFPLLSLFLTNFIVLFIFSYFFDITIKSWHFWIFFVIGFLFSLITIRTNYIIYWKTKNKEKEDKNKETIKIPKIGRLISIILLIKNLFFNILNDLFILTIIWTVLFSVFYLFEFVNTNNFNHLATTITLIGILSGFFQFYIKNYNEQVSMKIANSIYQYTIKITKKVSLSDFLNGLEDNEKKDIKKIISSREEFKGYLMGFRQKPFTLINMPFAIKDISIFDNIDYLIEEKLVKDIKLDSDKLNDLYKSYFEKKFKEFKEEIDKKDLIQIRKLLFSNLIFFDEMLAYLEKINLELLPDKDIEKPKGFREHYEKFSYNCVYYMLDVLLNFKDDEDEIEKPN